MALACLALPMALQADVLVTNLSPITAVYDGGTIATTAGGLAQPNLAGGHAFNIEFTPTADDLSGTVLLLEIGGTSNGTGLYLIDGVLTYVTKHNGTDDALPTGLNDTAIDPAAAVTNSYGTVSAGVAYSVAASWDQGGHLILAIQADEQMTGKIDTITMTGAFGNWSGDESFSVGQNPRLGAGGPGGSVGGLAGEVAGDEYGAPFDVEDDAETPLLKSFSGTIARALYWNAVGEIGLFPTGTATGLSWTNNGTGAYGVAANWNPNRVPTAGDSPIIANGGTAQIDDGTAYSVSNLFIATADATSGKVRISNGSLTVLDSAATYIGGKGGVGSVEVLPGGAFSKPNGVFRLGPGGGSGSLNVTNGAVYLNQLHVGGDDTTTTSGGHGYVNLSGGSIVVTNFMVVGRDFDVGLLTINGGALTNLDLDNQFLTIAGPGGTGTVEIVSGTLYVGNGVRLANGDAANPSQGTLKLNGGTLITSQLFQGGSGQAGSVEFNGGVLQALTNNDNFTPANASFMLTIKSGGAIIDTAGFDITIGQGIGTDYSGGSLTKNGGGTLTLTNQSYYEGPTVVNAGGLNIEATSLAGGGPVTMADDTTLGVTVATEGSEWFGSSLTLGSSGDTTLNLNLGNFGNPIVAPIYLSGALAANGTVTLNISGRGFTVGSFPLIQFGSLGGGGFSAIKLGSLPRGMTATLVNSGSSIDLNVTGYVDSLFWTGAENSNWDLISQNWVDGNTSTAAAYSQANNIGDSVTFDDSHIAASQTINVTTNVTPLTVSLNNNLYDYAFTGAGSISGPTAINKDGPAILTLATDNAYSGGTRLNQGSIQVGNDHALGTGLLTVNGGALSSDSSTPRTIANDIYLTSAFTIGDSNNTGTVTLAGKAGLDVNLTLTLNSDVVISGTLTNIIPDRGLDNIDGPGKLTVTASGVVDIAELFEQGNGNVVVDGGTFINREGYRLYSPAPNSTQILLVTNGAYFAMDHRIGDLAGGGNLVIGGNVRTGSDATATNIVEVAPNSTVAAITASGGNGRVLFSQANGGAVAMMNIESNATVRMPRFEGQQGASGRISELNINGGTVSPIDNEGDFIRTLSAANILAGGATVDTAGFSITIAQSLLGEGGLTKSGGGSLYLNGANTYTGTTLVNQGTLGGTGSVSGPLTVAATGDLAPGNGGIGTLTANGALSISGSVTAEVRMDGGVAQNDTVAGFSSATYGGHSSCRTRERTALPPVWCLTCSTAPLVRAISQASR